MAPGTPIVTVADLSNVWLRGFIDEADLGRVKLGQHVRIDHGRERPTPTSTACPPAAAPSAPRSCWASATSPPSKHRLAGNLSGGMKQKLGLACALIHTPRVLFLDEPTNGVDPVSRRDFWRILYQLVRDGVTLFVSTAYLDEAERCNRLALLHQGRLVGLGTPAEIKRLLPGALLEVRTSDPRRTAPLLRERLPGATVGLFGDRVHVATRDPTAADAQIRRHLADAGFELLSLRPIEPSLEDVFVSVIAAPTPAGP